MAEETRLKEQVAHITAQVSSLMYANAKLTLDNTTLSGAVLGRGTHEDRVQAGTQAVIDMEIDVWMKRVDDLQIEKEKQELEEERVKELVGLGGEKENLVDKVATLEKQLSEKDDLLVFYREESLTHSPDSYASNSGERKGKEKTDTTTNLSPNHPPTLFAATSPGADNPQAGKSPHAPVHRPYVKQLGILKAEKFQLFKKNLQPWKARRRNWLTRSFVSPRLLGRRIL